ncbi:hypothetical protein FLONG3_5285 [Fusarium longipes]|uniref:Uncharacterized protein n=1 Tax=Fusarium longipes TaxID=694270 RepID=A0A395SV86_9HYPO|nr:hypothetical protein FLONG3_5285 [Fusarium longipes]
MPPQAPNNGENARLNARAIRNVFPHVRGCPSGAIINYADNLTLAELQALVPFLQLLAAKMNTPATIADFRRFLLTVFDGWTSRSHVFPHPLVPERKLNDTRILVGILKQDLPLSRNQRGEGAEQRRARRVGQPVYFGLSLLWAQLGTAMDPAIAEAERPVNLLQLVLAGPTGEAEALRMIQAVD